MTTSEAKKLVPIQIAEAGTFKGHPAGPFALDDKVFDQIVQNFERDGLPIPIDAEHASEQDATSGSIPVTGAPAMGWIHKLEKRDGALWGLVEWLEPAKSYIKEGRYRYLSPAIRFGARDRVSGASIGARLTSAAITNTPFLKSMRPLTARDGSTSKELARCMNERGQVAFVGVEDAASAAMSGAACYSAHEYMPKIRAALRMDALSTPAQCSDKLGTLRDMLAECGGDAGAMHTGVQLADYLHPMRGLVGAHMGMTWDEVLDIVEDLIHAAIAQHEAEYHEGEEPSGAGLDDEDGGDAALKDAITSAANGAAGTNGDSTMTEANKSKDIELENANLSLKLKDADANVANLKLELKDKASKIETLEGEVKTLKDKAEKDREERIVARVDEAFSAYKDARKLTDEDKELMLIVAKADPGKFDQRYPRVAADKSSLLVNMTGPNGLMAKQNGTATPAPNAVPGSDKPQESIVQMADRLMKDDARLTRDQAFAKAEKEIKARREAAAKAGRAA